MIYLAEAGIRPHLANLPDNVQLTGPKNRDICGQLGAQTLDFRTLKEAPHKVFVNWPPHGESILAFTKSYGLLDPNGKYCAWKLNEDKYDRGATRAAQFADRRSFIRTGGVRVNTFSFSIASWVQAQKYFREYWDGNEDWGKWDVVRLDLTTELMSSDIIGAPPMLRHPGLIVDDLIGLGPKPIFVLAANTLWQYLCALLVFHKAGDLRHCKNPDCPAPRFIAHRKDQVYCSSDCAGLIAKRRWWAVHGEHWRQRRLRKKLKRGQP
jgi:hypothetical protein